MLKQHEGFFSGVNSTQLYFQTWEASQVAAHLVITHGHGEHSECYLPMVQALNLPIKAWAWDLRGHGKSQGARGAASDFSLYTQDFEIFLTKVVEIEKKKEPVILFAHSMGGLVQLKSLLGAPRLQKRPQILSAPFLGLAMPVPAWKETVSKIVYGFLPEFTLDNELSYDLLSSDPEMQERYRKDPYRHHRMSAGVYEPALLAMDNVMANAHRFHGPILIFSSDADPVVSTPKIQEFFEKLGSQEKRLRLFAGRKHEVINDLGRDEAIDLIRKNIEKYTK